MKSSLNTSQQRLISIFYGQSARELLMDFYRILCLNDLDHLLDIPENMDILEMQDEALLNLFFSKIFKNKILFTAYLNFFRANRNSFLEDTEEWYALFLLDYFVWLQVDTVHYILELANPSQLGEEMSTTMIPGTQKSFKDGLQEAIKRWIPVNTKGEILYFIKKDMYGNLVYSGKSGIHYVNDSGWVADMDWILKCQLESLVEEWRSFKRIAKFLSEKQARLGLEDANILKKIIEAVAFEPLESLLQDDKKVSLLGLKIRFFISQEIADIDRRIEKIRWKLFQIVGWWNVWDDELGPHTPEWQVIANRSLIRLVK